MKTFNQYLEEKENEGEYYADYEQDRMRPWCVFHTDKTGSGPHTKSYGCFARKEEAEKYAKELNEREKSK